MEKSLTDRETWEPVLSLAIDCILERIDPGVVFMGWADGDSYRVLGVWGKDAGLLQESESLLALIPCDTVIETQQPLRISNMSEHDYRGRVGYAPTYPFGSYLGVPVTITGADLRFTLATAHTYPHDFSDTDKDFLVAMAGILALHAEQNWIEREIQDQSDKQNREAMQRALAICMRANQAAMSLLSCWRSQAGRFQTEGPPQSLQAEVKLPPPVVPARAILPPHAHGRCALVMECDPVLREMLAAKLKDLGWQVVVCDKSTELEAASGAGVAIAFIDAMMPGKLNFVRAYDFLRRQCPDCVVFVTTSDATDCQLADYIRSAAGCIVKPASRDKVAAFLEVHLASRKVPS